MGHIVLATPGIGRFHLHERLLRWLRQRGHRASVVCVDPVVHRFWRHQDPGTVTLAEPAGPTAAVPIDDLAPAAGAGLRRALARGAAALDAWFHAERPDLVLLHQDRGPGAKLAQFVARTAGCRVLWTGDGLLPHTLQLDERGLDGDASCAHRAAAEFRVVPGEPGLLAACLANALARTTPFALGRAPVVAPPLAERWRDVLATWGVEGPARAVAGLWAWRRALQPRDGRPRAAALPEAPFVAVLLQRPDDPRVVHDGAGSPTAAELVRAAAAAVQRLGGGVRVVAVAPDDRCRSTLAGQPLLPAAAAADAAAVALAVVTGNHPLASVALLAGTPVLHTGQALYGVRGVATRTTADRLAEDLPAALAHDYPTLRQRFLSWVFGHGHLWCSPTHPDHNGMLGFVNAIEARLAAPAVAQPPLRHRAGPGWPLAADGRLR